ncbi:MAG: tyrosine protein phosphatase [Desulfobacterium sp.]
MIDIHTHILPGIDDGASSMAVSVAMARMAASEGVRAMVATPHAFDGVYNSQKKDVINGCRELNEALKHEGVPVEILSGQEVHLTPELLENIDARRVLTLNYSQYLLIELPMHVLPRYLPEMIRSIRHRDLVPIIAHPERNPVLMSRMALVEELHYCGALLQVTAGSLAGMFGRDVKKCAVFLAKEGLVHFLGSDAHAATGRTPSMAKGMAKMRKVTGEDMFFQYDALKPVCGVIDGHTN